MLRRKPARPRKRPSPAMRTRRAWTEPSRPERPKKRPRRDASATAASPRSINPLGIRHRKGRHRDAPPRVRSAPLQGVLMDRVIGELIDRFERGGLTRRQLIEGLTTLVAVAGVSPVAAQATGLKGTGINHTSVLVTDLQR